MCLALRSRWAGLGRGLRHPPSRLRAGSDRAESAAWADEARSMPAPAAGVQVCWSESQRGHTQRLTWNPAAGLQVTVQPEAQMETPNLKTRKTAAAADSEPAATAGSAPGLTGQRAGLRRPETSTTARRFQVTAGCCGRRARAAAARPGLRDRDSQRGRVSESVTDVTVSPRVRYQDRPHVRDRDSPPDTSTRLAGVTASLTPPPSRGRPAPPPEACPRQWQADSERASESEPTVTFA